MAHGTVNGPFPHGLNFKQEAFCRSYLEQEGNGTKAALAAGYGLEATSNAPAVAASTLLTKPNIQERIRELAEQVGLSVGSCLETIQRKLKAQKPVVIGKEVQLFDDNQAQLRAAELGLKVHGIAMTGETSNITNNLLSLTQYSVLSAQHHDKKP